GYNVRSLIKGLPQEVQQSFWDVQMPTVNGGLYAVGLSICIPLCWPVLRSLRRGTEATPEIRNMSLWMADYIFWVVLLAWALSGLIYPVWIDLQVPGLVGAAFRYHFFTSQLLFGLLAGTLAYFADSFITVRALHPALLQQ